MTAPRERTAWLAAYAVGLAYTDQGDQSCLEKLLATDPSSKELGDADALLAGWTLVDRDHHTRAMRILRLGRQRARQTVETSSR